MSALGISHRSPLITSRLAGEVGHHAGNQSPFPFDNICALMPRASPRWESVTVPL